MKSTFEPIGLNPTKFTEINIEPTSKLLRILNIESNSENISLQFIITIQCIGINSTLEKRAPFFIDRKINDIRIFSLYFERECIKIIPTKLTVMNTGSDFILMNYSIE